MEYRPLRTRPDIQSQTQKLIKSSRSVSNITLNKVAIPRQMLQRQSKRQKSAQNLNQQKSQASLLTEFKFKRNKSIEKLLRQTINDSYQHCEQQPPNVSIMTKRELTLLLIKHHIQVVLKQQNSMVITDLQRNVDKLEHDKNDLVQHLIQRSNVDTQIESKLRQQNSALQQQLVAVQRELNNYIKQGSSVDEKRNYLASCQLTEQILEDWSQLESTKEQIAQQQELLSKYDQELQNLKLENQKIKDQSNMILISNRKVKVQFSEMLGKFQEYIGVQEEVIKQLRKQKKNSQSQQQITVPLNSQLILPHKLKESDLQNVNQILNQIQETLQIDFSIANIITDQLQLIALKLSLVRDQVKVLTQQLDTNKAKLSSINQENIKLKQVAKQVIKQSAKDFKEIHKLGYQSVSLFVEKYLEYKKGKETNKQFQNFVVKEITVINRLMQASVKLTGRDQEVYTMFDQFARQVEKEKVEDESLAEFN